MAIYQPELCPEDPDSPGSSCQSHHGNTPASTVSGGSRQSRILLSVPSWQYTSQNCVRRIPTVRDPPVSPIMEIHQPALCPEDPDSPGSSCQSHHGNTPARTVSGQSRQSRIASDDGTVFAEDPDRPKEIAFRFVLISVMRCTYMHTHYIN